MPLKVTTSPSIHQLTFDGSLAYWGRDGHIAYLGDLAGNPVMLSSGFANNTISFDVRSQLGPSQQINNVTIALDEGNGVDTWPSGKLGVGPTVQGTVIYQDVARLEPSGLYIMTYGLTLGPPRWDIRFKVPFRSTDVPAEGTYVLAIGPSDILAIGPDPDVLGIGGSP